MPSRHGQIGSTPNTSLCSSMNLTSASVTGPAWPRRKARQRARSRSRDGVPCLSPQPPDLGKLLAAHAGALPGVDLGLTDRPTGAASPAGRSPAWPRRPDPGLVLTPVLGRQPHHALAEFPRVLLRHEDHLSKKGRLPSPGRFMPLRVRGQANATLDAPIGILDETRCPSTDDYAWLR
jgi:hypothetical protein